MMVIGLIFYVAITTSLVDGIGTPISPKLSPTSSMDASKGKISAIIKSRLWLAQCLFKCLKNT